MAGRRRASEGNAPLTVAVRVTPRARRNAITLEGDTLRVWLTAPPVDGAANAALLALLAERLGVPKRAVTLVRGETAREKVVAIEGMDSETLRQRLANCT